METTSVTAVYWLIAIVTLFGIIGLAGMGLAVIGQIRFLQNVARDDKLEYDRNLEEQKHAYSELLGKYTLCQERTVILEKFLDRATSQTGGWFISGGQVQIGRDAIGGDSSLRDNIAKS